ncbi:MAG: penicillin-binding protein 2 [Candidatus Obscuribacterales bacterium]|nr:penicillin-binding protein 2 [Candidatus Obscuribacterales bacterium]
MVQSSGIGSGSTEIDNPGKRAAVLLFVVGIAMTALAMRLVWLQVLQNNFYKARALENSTRVTFLRAPRGIIYDRHGNMVATNKQTLSLVAVPLQLEDVDAVAVRLSRILELPYADIKARLEKAKVSDSVLPVVIERDLSLEIVSRFYDQKLFLPAIEVMPDISRNYPQGELFCHVMGYCGEITESQLARRPERRMGDVVGQEGIERLYDTQLRGIDGEQRVRVNAAGETFSRDTAKPVVTKEAQAGLPVVLSIDTELQQAAAEALGERHGAVVACDPRTGEILALVSNPKFDPNCFTRRITPDVWKKLNAPDHPLFNRALSGFPPGSIWKAITTLAALEYKVVKPDTKLRVSGGIALGGFFFHDWTSASGVFDLVKCLAWSRDSAYYQMALKMTPEMIKEWGMKFGAGRPTGVELPHESSGLVPDSEWKLRVCHEKWYPGNTLHMSIGQTFLQVTPLQALRIFAGLGQRGVVPNLHMVIKVGDRLIPPPVPEKVKIKKEYMDVVSKGLKAVVASGTGGATRLGNVEVAGKTGSAEAPPIGSKTHAWFCCYAPADKPTIAICAFIEHGGHGGSAAAPVARVVLDKYFGKAAPATTTVAPGQKGKRRRH